ncbi:ferrous iron transport protein A [Candidatus Peregrinibacteria bacterium]|nr:ferrous iron transport protein A [Candidatus Peregrinibacteria bacterium]
MEISLLDLQTGKTAKISRVEGGSEAQSKLAALNIRVGKTVKKITMQPFRGPVVIAIGNTKVTLGRGLAMKIFVEPEK